MLLGIDIGGTKCAVTVGTKEGEIIAKERFATTTAEETLLKIRDAVEQFRDAYPLEACGISCGGPLDEREGIIL